MRSTPVSWQPERHELQARSSISAMGRPSRRARLWKRSAEFSAAPSRRALRQRSQEPNSTTFPTSERQKRNWSLALAIVLLSSNEESLIETVRHLAKSQDDLALLVCRNLKEARAAMAQEEIRAVLIHTTNEGDDAQVTEFLQMVAGTARPCPTVVLADAYRDSQAI